MPRILGTIVKLLVACLIVGAFLSWLDFTPQELLHAFPETVAAIWGWVFDVGQEAGPYILLGAVVVIPIWLIRVLFSLGKNKRLS